jgi:hypothetical protein
VTSPLRSAAHDDAGIADWCGTGSGRGAGIDALYSIRKEVEDLFSNCADDLEELRGRAAGVSAAVETAGLFIERHTSVLCPACLKVCCVNRHSYHELADIICICALGERAPFYSRGAGDTEPCQFLGERGCSIRRPLRPHRCNWYFCGPLLEHIQTVPAREYRRFIAALRDINERREGLINAFAGVVKRAGYDFGRLRRASEEFF